MRLWRRIVTVLAGTMIAAGGIIGALAFSEPSVQAPQASGAAPRFGALDTGSAHTAVQSDVAAVTAWVDATAARGDPSAEERVTAAVAADAVMDLSSSGSNATVPPLATSGRTISEVYPEITEAAAAGVREQAIAIVLAPTVQDSANYDRMTLDGDAGGADESAFRATASVYAFAVTPTTAQAAPSESDLKTGLNAFADTDHGVTDFYTDGQPTDLVGLRATAGAVAQPAYNWSDSARDAILRADADGSLEQDTLNLSLASQVLRLSNPPRAAAINAELSHRQAADGSVGDIRETSEAARAFALGGGGDFDAARGALNWLDAQGPLPASLAVWRLRAHAYDNLLVAPPPPPATAAGGSALGDSLGSIGGRDGKAALAGWLLVGGIGLSLSLVTVDALKGARQRLYDTIRSNPGLHVNELRRRLRMSPSAVEYHLAVLTGAGLVVAEDDGRYKRFYANGAGLGLNPGSPNSRNTLGALRRPHAVTLVRALLEAPNGSSARELSRLLSIHESAVSRRLAHLEDCGLLVSERDGRARMFKVRDTGSAFKALTAVEAPSLPVVAATTNGPAPRTDEAVTSAMAAAAPSH